MNITYLKSDLRLGWLILVLLFSPLFGQAQTAKSEKNPAVQVMEEAMERRAELARALAAGEIKGTDVLKELQAWKSPYGFTVQSGADKAWAAIDIAQRAIVLGSGEEAMVVFSGAEQTLDALMARGSNAEKVEHLQKLAWLRSRYLNKPDQAAKDIEQALRLAPENEDLKKKAAALASDRAETFKRVTNPKR